MPPVSPGLTFKTEISRRMFEPQLRQHPMISTVQQQVNGRHIDFHGNLILTHNHVVNLIISPECLCCAHSFVIKKNKLMNFDDVI